MASSIDATKPTATVAYTADVRQNFSYAKSEIEALQGAVAATTGTVTTGTLELGHASDTTLARSAAGVVTIEGSAVLVSGGALGTPSGGTLTSCTGLPPAGISLSATDRLVGRSTAGAGAGEEITCTAAGRSLIGAADAPAQRAIIEAAAPSVVTITTSTTLTAASHQGKVLYCTTGALSLTVDNSTDFDAYASCEIVNKTGAVVTFVATATINRIGSKPLTLPANGRATLMREATADTYLLTGEMA